MKSLILISPKLLFPQLSLSFFHSLEAFAFLNIQPTSYFDMSFFKFSICSRFFLKYTPYTFTPLLLNLIAYSPPIPLDAPNIKTQSFI